MKHISKKRLAILLVSVVALLAVAVGGTLAFLSAHTDPLVNEFTPSEVACEVVENFNGTVKSDVQIKNTGDTEAYIRVAVIVNWKNADGDVYAQKPVEGTDYTITYAENSGWIKGSDGYRYYTDSVPSATQTTDASKTVTNVLIQSCRLADTAAVPAGYQLSVEIAASAVQAAPANVVESTWTNVSVGTDGKLQIN